MIATTTTATTSITLVQVARVLSMDGRGVRGEQYYADTNTYHIFSLFNFQSLNSVC